MLKFPTLWLRRSNESLHPQARVRSKLHHHDRPRLQSSFRKSQLQRALRLPIPILTRPFSIDYRHFLPTTSVVWLDFINVSETRKWRLPSAQS